MLAFLLTLLFAKGINQSWAKDEAYHMIDFQKGKAAMFPAPPKSCGELMRQANTTMELSKNWLEQRRMGNRRIDSGDLIFFQYDKNKLRSPFLRIMNAQTKKIIAEIFYDPLEFLGYLHKQSIQKNCGDDSDYKEPKWPFSGFDGSADEISVSFLKKLGDRLAYVESFDSQVTDIYYCQRKIPENTLDKFVEKLGKVFANGRLENTPVFVEFTEYREKLCGEKN